MAGELISDRYLVEGKLGAGGMSTVYLATDQVLERKVAVKVLAENLSDDEKFVARFRREALAAAKLIHPNIVQVYDTGAEGRLHFIVMEYVEGQSGAQLLRERGRVDADTAVEIGGQACEGLDYAHRNGIVHRDVKPGNLIITEAVSDGRIGVKIADFGIARAAEQTRITQVGSVLGTAAYLSPEQATGEEASAASDVYSLGVVLYQFLAGRLPYEGSSLTELAVRQRNEQPLSPHDYHAEIPQELGWAVLRALEVDPQDRYPDARAFGEGLRRALQGEGEPPPEREAETRVLAQADDSEPTIRVRRTRPEQPTRRPPQPRPVIEPEDERGRDGAGPGTRVLVALLLLVALGAAVAAIVASTAGGGGRDVRVRQVVERDAGQQIDGLRQLVSENTR